MNHTLVKRTDDLARANADLAAANQALQQTEERYRLLFDSNPHPVWVYDLQTLAFLDVNRSALQNYGYSREEFLSRTIKDIRPGEDVPALLESVSHAPLAAEIAGVWRHRKKDGSLIAVEIVSHPIAFEGRNARLVVSTDVTERKRAEEALHASEEKFRTLAETANDAILSANGDGSVVYFNRAAERMFGYSASEVIGQPLTRLMPERFRGAHAQGFERFLRTGEARVIGKTVELAGLRKDGSEFPVEISLSTWRTRGEVFFSGILSDTSQRKGEEKSKALFRSAAEDGQRALLNILEDFAAEKSGLEHGQRAVLNILDDFDSEKERMEGAQRAVLNILEDSVAEKTQLEAAQRSVLNILDDFATEKAHLETVQRSMVNILDDFSDEKGRLEEAQRAVLNILDDFELEKNKVESVNQQLQGEIEERKRIELQVKGINTELLAANKELEAFSYSVSHDLRAPLRGIDGFSLALLEDYADKLDDEGKDYLQRVRSATQRMGVLIDDLLNLARVTRSEMKLERTDLASIARSVAAELRKTQPERLAEFRIDEALIAFADPHLMRITFENLLGNAWKFTSKRESACIEFARTSCDGERAYYIKDNGAGFDPNYAHRLFGAFQRLHDKSDFPGTGVGLATVQRIVHRHGGRIWAKSAPDEGATFYFTLSERAWRPE